MWNKVHFWSLTAPALFGFQTENEMPFVFLFTKTDVGQVSSNRFYTDVYLLTPMPGIISDNYKCSVYVNWIK